MSTKDRKINAKSRTQFSVFNQDKNKKVTKKLPKLPSLKNRYTQLGLLSFLISTVTFKVAVGLFAGLNRLTQTVRCNNSFLVYLSSSFRNGDR